MEFLIVPSIFMAIVAPVWIIMHYSYKKKMSQGLTEQERRSLDRMLEQVDVLVNRIETLESILDEKHPHWRSQKEAGNE